MTPSKPFLFALAGVAVAAVVIIDTPRARPAAAQESLPLATGLTSEMIDYFGLEVAFERPSITALVACEAAAACGASDSSRVRFLDATGRVVPDYDGAPTTVIEQTRREQRTTPTGAAEQRTLVRRFSKDDQGRVVMYGRDSIVKRTPAAGAAPAEQLVRIRRYSDVRYLVNDPTLPWPLTGLVVLELSHVVGTPAAALAAPAGHAAVSFDGSAIAQILTTGAISHKVNLQARRLETTLPER
jgi:hypothetical protein